MNPTSSHPILLEHMPNPELLAHVHPADYVNPVPQGRYNLVVIGGGTAGLAAAIGAAELGARVALVEQHLLGGRRVHTGSVPFQALLRTARAAHELTSAREFGLKIPACEVDFAAVTERVRNVRAQIAVHDGIHALKQKNVDVYFGQARFLDSSVIEVDDSKLSFARAVIATGTRPTIPDIPGMDKTEFLTNESVFELTELPRLLVVLGGGQSGCEFAQAFARLGSQVTLIESGERLLARDDPDASKIIQASLERDGVTIHLNAKNLSCSKHDDAMSIACDVNGKNHLHDCDHVLVTVGRTPNVEHMNLDRVGVKHSRDGIDVNDRLRTTHPRIFACGDVCSDCKFTHAAGAMAHIVIGNALFFSTAKMSDQNIPWVTCTDPEIAHVGVPAHSAEGKKLSTIVLELRHQDRAILDGATEGFIKVVHDARGTIKGATIVDKQAAELIGEIVVAMNHNISLGKLSSAIHPYPTHSEMIKKCGDLYRRTLLTPTVSNLLSTILKWRR